MGNMLACPPEEKIECVSNYHSQKFIKRHHTSTPSGPHNHTHTLTPNERIVVSRQDGGAWAIAMGTVARATSDEVELLLDRYM